MPMNYVLIDFENVQPKNLEILSKHPFKVYVFVGANQTKMPTELAIAMQVLGENAKYIRISGNGRNALDFHITYYLGELVSKDPKGHYHVITRDTGFDPLIKHLQDKNVHVQREKDLAEIPVLRMATGTSDEEKIEAIVKNLVGRGQSRPRKVNTLANTINTLFTKRLEEHELNALINVLKKRKYISVDQNKVTYSLPK